MIRKVKEKLHYLRFPAFLFKGNNGEYKWSQLEDKGTQSCFLALVSLMSGKWGWKTKANANTIARMTGVKNKTRVRESLSKLGELGFISRRDGYYALDKNLKVKVIPVSKKGTRFNQSYYFVEPEMFRELISNCTKNEQTIFLFLAVKGTIDDDPENDFYGTFNRMRGKRYWELLGISRRSWFECLERLEGRGWIAIGESGAEIYILTGRKPEGGMRMQTTPATEKRREKERKARFEYRPKLSYM